MARRSREEILNEVERIQVIKEKVMAGEEVKCPLLCWRKGLKILLSFFDQGDIMLVLSLQDCLCGGFGARNRNERSGKINAFLRPFDEVFAAKGVIWIWD